MSELIQLGRLNERPIAPKPEELKLQFSDKAIKELEKLLTHYPDKKSAALPALWLAQREYGGELTGQAIQEVAHRLQRSYSEIEGVATFYSMYNTHSTGRHKIEVCTCLTCQVCDGYKIMSYLKEKLDLNAEGNSPDGLFTVHEVECLNACDRAPLIQVGDKYHGPIDEEYLDKLIKKLKNDEESSVVNMANEIFQVHLRDTEKIEESDK